MRTIILHYHLFKNAGTSLDQILKNNFGDAWVTEEFTMSGNNNTKLVEDWIAQTPDAVSYSSHTMLGPLPVVDGVRVIPVILLRNPIKRIRSAYAFERSQAAETWGTQLARAHDLEGYVRARLAVEGDRQCRNFQTYRLASMQPGDAPELDRAISATRIFKQTGVLGRVEYFPSALNALTTRLTPVFPDFHAEAVRANVSKKPDADQTTDQDEIVNNLLTEFNQDDLTLIDAAT